MMYGTNWKSSAHSSNIFSFNSRPSLTLDLFVSLQSPHSILHPSISLHTLYYLKKYRMSLDSDFSKKILSGKGETISEDAKKLISGKGETAIISEDAEKSIKFYVSSRQVGLSREESVKIYDKWAETYDMECPLVGYNGPQHIANAVGDYYTLEQRKTINILDVAAGTGLVGKELGALGFSRIDALEPSEGMLKHLRALNVYDKIFQDTIGSNTTIDPLPTDAYDCLTIAGGLGNGHIPVEGLDELIRVVKPGGTIFIVILEEHLSSKHACGGQLEPYMEKLEKQSCWTKLRRTVVDNYTWKEPGVVFGFKVMVSSVPAP